MDNVIITQYTAVKYERVILRIAEKTEHVGLSMPQIMTAFLPVKSKHFSVHIIPAVHTGSSHRRFALLYRILSVCHFAVCTSQITKCPVPNRNLVEQSTVCQR